MSAPTIAGVEIKPLTTHSDARGFFREVVRVDDPEFQEGFGQWSHSLMHQETIKAWHLHKLQTDWWYVPFGVIRAAMHDLREDSPTKGVTMEVLMGDHQAAKVLKVPPGVAHGCRVLQGPAHLFYITSHTYNPDDELRLPHDDPGIGYDWLRHSPIT